MAIIGFDIDDTVADGMSVFIPAQNKYFNKNVLVQDLNISRLHELYGVSEEELKAYFVQSGPKLLPQLLPFEGAVNMVNHLYDAGHTIYFITARPEINSKYLTEKWLKKYGFKYNGLYFSKTKVELCQELGIDIFIDDHPRIVENIHAVGIKTIFVDSEKNKNIITSPGIYREENPSLIFATIIGILHGII